MPPMLLLLAAPYREAMEDQEISNLGPDPVLTVVLVTGGGQKGQLGSKGGVFPY